MSNTENQEMNPITRLDYPDPDVIRVDDTYYMVNPNTYNFTPSILLRIDFLLFSCKYTSFNFVFL